MEVSRRLLDTEVNVEEIGLLFSDHDDRQAVDDQEWQRLAGRVTELSDVAAKVAHTILGKTEVIDAEGWDVDGTIAELAGGDDNIVDAELVGED